jgi:NAD-dependent SIR2 family protein deacetylase
MGALDCCRIEAALVATSCICVIHSRRVNEHLIDFLRSHRGLFVLTGAGISTGSGIADYRDVHGAWKQRAPVQLDAFLRSEVARRRYWSRSMIGWPRFACARPNAAHWALARLQQAGFIGGTVTQNVDGLHDRAGHRGVVELHGRLGVVACLACEAQYERASVQQWLEAANPTFGSRTAPLLADGDADFDAADLDGFVLPQCPACGGVLKPGVVFFGESVPQQVVQRAFELLDAATAVLVIGSSLMVQSGYRFCRRAHAQGKPVVAINRGVTRADPLLHFKVDSECGVVLRAISDGLDLCFDA